MKVKVVQPRVKLLNIKENYERMKFAIENTQSSVDMIVFPQNVLLGAMHNDHILDDGIQKELAYYQDKLSSLNPDVWIAWGDLCVSNEYIYPSIVLAKDNKIERFYKQTANNTNGLFESKYYHSHSNLNNTVEIADKKVSFSFLDDQLEDDQSVDLNVVIDSSFWRKEVKSKRIQCVSQYSNDVLYVNHVGMQNNGANVYVYDGGSFIIRNDKISYLFESFSQGEETINLKKTIISVDQKTNQYQALISLLKQYDEEVFPFKPTWIVGVSGGLDSSVSLGLLVKALGQERVLAVTMPSRFNQETTVNNAKKITTNLGVELLTIPIEDLANQSVETLMSAEIDVSSGLAYENTQARLRGHILMSVSSVRNGIIMNNGNKLETAFGYATMYGDAIGGISILADLNKLDVSHLAEQLNVDFDKEVVPLNLIAEIFDDHIEWDFAPSAELADNQNDPMKWGYHDFLLDYLLEHSVEEVMELYLSGHITKTRFGKYLKFYNLDKPELFIDDLTWVIKQLYGSIYKRIQMPPIAVLSEKAFGSGHVESQIKFFQTSRFKELKKEILEMTND